MRDLRILPRVADSFTFLYVEHCRIEQDSFSIKIVNFDGDTPIPVAQMTVLLIGPGTTITHAAIVAIADNGCLAVWCGEGGTKYYASGLGETKSSKNMLLQAVACTNNKNHLEIVKKMYKMRFKGMNVTDKTLDQLRGMEGVRVRTAYNQYSKMNGIDWKGRTYKKEDYNSSDGINKALTYTNQVLYALCHAVIVSLGFSPSLGFIHSGHILSFVFDIADLYKVETTIPASFEVVGKKKNYQNLEKELRIACRNYFQKTDLLKRMVKDLTTLFENDNELDISGETIALWSEGNAIVPQGRNYGGV